MCCSGSAVAGPAACEQRHDHPMCGPVDADGVGTFGFVLSRVAADLARGQAKAKS